MLTPTWHSMWLLNTSTAEQKFFADPNGVPGGYVILSHVWNSKEDSFQSVRDAIKVAKGEATLEQEVAALKKRIEELENMNAAAKEVIDATVKSHCASDLTSMSSLLSLQMCPPSEQRRVV